MAERSRARSRDGPDRLLNQLRLRFADRRLRISADDPDRAQPALLRALDRTMRVSQGGRLVRLVVRRFSKTDGAIASHYYRTGDQDIVSRATFRSIAPGRGEPAFARRVQPGLEQELGVR